MAQEGGNGLERHAPVDALGSEGVAELVGMYPADASASSHGGDVAVDGAPVEGLMVVAFDEQTGRCRSPPGPVVVDQTDQERMQRDGAVVVEFAQRDAQPVGVAEADMASSRIPPISPARMPVQANSSTMSRR